MSGTCFECKFMRNRTDLEPCEHCTNTFAMTGVHPSFTLKKPPTTNADKIRAMTDEELCSFLYWDADGCGKAKQEWLDWLKQEADNGN